jgi:hypothetical protein
MKANRSGASWLLALIQSAWAVYAAQTGDLPTSVELEWKRSEVPLITRGINLQQQKKPFAKEPSLGARETVCRGQLQFGSSPSNSLAVLWRVSQGKLHLDLNRNGDLTDDASGVFTSSSTNQFQQFTGLRLGLDSSSGRRTFLLDLSLSKLSDQMLYGSYSVRSFWSGRASWQGADLELGVVETLDNTSDVTGGGHHSFLILRPWGERDKPIRLATACAEAVGFPRKLFYRGGAAAIAKSFVTNREPEVCRLAFTQEQPALGDLGIKGSLLNRLIIEPDKEGYTVVIDSPGASAQMPVGSYRLSEIWAKKDSAEAWCNSSQRISVVADKPATNILAGGPLTNSVSVNRRGKSLVLSHRLVGVDGGDYQLQSDDRQHPPEVTIFLGEKKVNTGKFAYG